MRATRRVARGSRASDYASLSERVAVLFAGAGGLLGLATFLLLLHPS